MQYPYDAQGHMTNLVTWTHAPAGTGAATTTWYYHACRGWLAKKKYQGETDNSDDYSYTAAGRLGVADRQSLRSRRIPVGWDFVRDRRTAFSFGAVLEEGAKRDVGVVLTALLQFGPGRLGVKVGFESHQADPLFPVGQLPGGWPPIEQGHPLTVPWTLARRFCLMKDLNPV